MEYLHSVIQSFSCSFLQDKQIELFMSLTSPWIILWLFSATSLVLQCAIIQPWSHRQYSKSKVTSQFLFATPLFIHLQIILAFLSLNIRLRACVQWVVSGFPLRATASRIQFSASLVLPVLVYLILHLHQNVLYLSKLGLPGLCGCLAFVIICLSTTPAFLYHL